MNNNQGEKMKAFDVKPTIELALKNPSDTMLSMYAGDVAKEVEKIKISHSLETRAHTFSDGPGKVANKLTIEIDFSSVALQPDTHFGDHLCENLVEELASYVANYWDNQQ